MTTTAQGNVFKMTGESRTQWKNRWVLIEEQHILIFKNRISQSKYLFLKALQSKSGKLNQAQLDSLDVLPIERLHLYHASVNKISSTINTHAVEVEGVLVAVEINDASGERVMHHFCGKDMDRFIYYSDSSHASYLHLQPAYVDLLNMTCFIDLIIF